MDTISKRDAIGDERVGLALEDCSVELNGGRGEGRVHALGTPQEVLRVPVLSLNLGVNVNSLKSGLALCLTLAVSETSHLGKVLTSIHYEEKVVPGSIVRIGSCLVLQDNRLVTHVGAPHIKHVLVEHD